MNQNPMDDLFDELELADREMTLRVIKKLHPDWSMERVSSSLEDPEVLEKLLVELEEIPDGSLDDLPGL